MSVIRRLSQEYHMWLHLFFGFLAALIFQFLYPDSNFLVNLFVGLLANILPDIDHLLFFFVYGANTPYACALKKLLQNRQFNQAVNYCKTNHKNNTSVVTHNVFTFLLVLLISGYLQLQGHRSSGVFALSWSYHYLFDMLEDLLFFGRLNPNWFLKFGKARV